MKTLSQEVHGLKAQTIETLRHARDAVLVSEEHWTQGSLCRDAEGHVGIGMYGSQAASWCTVGSVYRACFELGFSDAVGRLALLTIGDDLRARTGYDHVVHYNDAADTTYSDVIDLFDETIKRAEQ